MKQTISSIIREQKKKNENGKGGGKRVTKHNI